jgi:ribonuclease HI
MPKVIWQPQHGASGQWSFLLVNLDTDETSSESDVEHEISLERLELLTVVRGLEFLDQPSQIILVTSSRTVYTGLTNHWATWKQNDWHWERFARWEPIRNHDLWRRIARALEFHQVECRFWREHHPHVPNLPRGQATARLRPWGRVAMV